MRTFELLETDMDGIYRRQDITLTYHRAKEWVDAAPFARKYDEVGIKIINPEDGYRIKLDKRREGVDK